MSTKISEKVRSEEARTHCITTYNHVQRIQLVERSVGENVLNTVERLKHFLTINCW